MKSREKEDKLFRLYLDDLQPELESLCIKDKNHRYTGLPRETIESLVDAAQKEHDIAAVHKLCIANQPLVLSVVKKYASCGVPLTDLVQAGNIGLLKAVFKYDRENSKNAKFSTYAMFWIRREISREVSTQPDCLYIPYNAHRTRAKALKIAAECREKGMTLDLGEIARQLNTNVPRLTRLLCAYRSRPSSKAHSYDLDDDLASQLPKGRQAARLSDNTEVLNAAVLDEHVDILYRALGSLPRQERRLLEMRFFDDYSLREIGANEGTSHETIRKRLKNAKRHLKIRLEHLKVDYT